MEWFLTMFAVHAIWLFIAVALYRAAPCWIQKVVMVMIVSAMALVAVSYMLAMMHNEYCDDVRLAGFAIGHVANLLYVFRVWWQNHQRLHSLQTGGIALPVAAGGAAKR